MIGIENYQELVEMINLNEFKESLVMAREDLVKSERNEMARCRGVRENEVNKSTVNSQQPDKTKIAISANQQWCNIGARNILYQNT